MSPSHLPAPARHAVFAPLDGSGRVALVESRLAEAIRLGAIADGEQLPSEAELAARLNVSTVTLREALAALRRRGLVETRRGRGGGTFVRSPREPVQARLRERLHGLAVDDLRDAADHHAAVAGAAAALAAQRASEPDLERLRAHVERLEAATGADRARADVRFHVEVAATARSVRLTRDEMAAQAEASALLWLAADATDAGAARDDAAAGPEHEAITGARAARDAAAARHAAEHRAIVAAIAARDGAAARRLAAAHVSTGMDRLLGLRTRLGAGAVAAVPARSAAERRRRARQVIAGVADMLDTVFASIDETRAELLAVADRARAAGRGPRRPDLEGIRALARGHLARHDGLVAGTGVVCAPGLLEDAPRWLEWWCAARRAAPRPLAVGLDPRDPDFYDYETADWFAAPRRTGQRSVAGPFVDYSGTNQHIVTLTLPVADSGGYLGVAGADVLVGQLAALVAPSLAALGEDAALLNHRGRVIAANAPGLVSGGLVADDVRAWVLAGRATWAVREDGAALARDGRLGWALLLAPGG